MNPASLLCLIDVKHHHTVNLDGEQTAAGVCGKMHTCSNPEFDQTYTMDNTQVLSSWHALGDGSAS